MELGLIRDSREDLVTLIVTGRPRTKLDRLSDPAGQNDEELDTGIFIRMKMRPMDRATIYFIVFSSLPNNSTSSRKQKIYLTSPNCHSSSLDYSTD